MQKKSKKSIVQLDIHNWRLYKAAVPVISESILKRRNTGISNADRKQTADHAVIVLRYSNRNQ